MKALMGLKNKGRFDFTSLVEKELDGDMSQLAKSINEFLVAVTHEMRKLNESHTIFQNLAQLPAQLTMQVADKNVNC